MPKYNVYLLTVASTVVEVEAEDKVAAADAVYEQALPYADAFCGFELGEWELGSDLFPGQSTFEEDIVEVEA